MQRHGDGDSFTKTSKRIVFDGERRTLLLRPQDRVAVDVSGEPVSSLEHDANRWDCRRFDLVDALASTFSGSGSGKPLNHWG